MRGFQQEYFVRFILKHNIYNTSGHIIIRSKSNLGKNRSFPQLWKSYNRGGTDTKIFVVLHKLCAKKPKIP